MEPTIGGGIINKHVLFINDCEEIITTSPKGLNFYKISNSQIIARIVIKENIVNYFEYDNENIIVFTEDGFITFYSLHNYSVVKKLRTIENVINVMQLSKEKYYVQSQRYNLIIELDMNSEIMNIKEVPAGIPSSNGKILYTFEGKNIYGLDLKENVKFRTRIEGTVKSLFIHPNNQFEVFVTCTSGRIYLLHLGDSYKYRNQQNLDSFGFYELSPSINTFHWHYRQFDGFSLFQNGNKMITGGDNGVLVFWNIHDGKTLFMPEIGDEIKMITVDKTSQFAAVSLVNNSIVIVSLAQRKITKIISGIIRSDKVRIHNGPTGQIITTGNGPILQFYDPSGDRCIANAEVSRPNVLLGSLQKEKLPDADIQHVAMIGEDEWMVTYDYREMSKRYHESNLRFFRKKQNGTFEQLVVIPEPFQSRITSIASSPSHKIVITTSEDHVFKVWVLVARKAIQTKSGMRSHLTWKCRSIGAYYGEPSYSASISNDGSIMIVSFKTAITVWDIASNKLLFSLPIPSNSLTQQVTSNAMNKQNQYVPVKVQFLSNNQYLLTKSKDAIIIYDIISRKIFHSILCNPLAIASHPKLELYSFINKNGSSYDIFLMNIKSMKPIAIWRLEKEVTSIVFYTTVTGVEYICVVTKDCETYMLPLENMINAKEESENIPMHPSTKGKKTITLQNLEMDEETNESKMIKIVSEATLDGLESNISDVNSIFNVIIDCLLK